jgi:hypothetical protein
MKRLCEKTLFTLLLVMVVALALYLSVDLSPVARMVPLTVLIPTLGLLLIQLALDLSPRLARGWARLALTDVRGIEPAKQGPQESAQVSSGSTAAWADSRRGQGKAILSVLTVLASVYLCGFLIAVPVNTLVYLRVSAKESWVFSIGSALAMVGVFYCVFGLALDTNMYEGVLWTWLGL